MMPDYDKIEPFYVLNIAFDDNILRAFEDGKSNSISDWVVSK